MRLIKIAVLIVLVNISCFAFADEEAANRPIVKSSEYGAMYAKSVPNDHYGTEGKTFVYTVEKEDDKLLYAFDWFSNEIYLGSMGSVVRLGPWARGHEPSESDLAIGFYVNGKKVKEYSTLDIATMGYDKRANVSMSVSHYTVFEDIIGYRWIKSNIWGFDVKTHEGKTLSFDVSTGELKSQ